ncbi:hypothetical protein BGW41_005100 [Actinomortierella wolfii]|nr:hypothetical protein BGW41_005100 [Actinomortierella wolfii]
MTSRGIAILLVMLAFIVLAAHANTEIVKFTAGQSIFADENERAAARMRISVPVPITNPLTWPQLDSPHTLIRNEIIQPSYTREEDLAHRLKEIPGTTEDQWKTLEVRWYVLNQLDQDAGYELRVSYPSTTPADFEMKVWTLAEAQECLGKNLKYGGGNFSYNPHLTHYFEEETTMFASIKAVYTGISYQRGPDTLPITYNLVLERLYFVVVPYQALKLALAIAVAVVIGFVILVPRIHRYLIHVAATGSEPESSWSSSSSSKGSKAD